MKPLPAKQGEQPIIKGVIGIVFGQRDPLMMEFYVDKVGSCTTCLKLWMQLTPLPEYFYVCNMT